MFPVGSWFVVLVLVYRAMGWGARRSVGLEGDGEGDGD